MSIKTVFDGQIHRSTLPEISFKALQDKLELTYGAGKLFRIRYEDEDNDIISVSSTPELKEAFRVLEDKKTLKLFISLVEHDMKEEPEHSVSCSRCGSRISGTRFQCTICPNFNLCSKCDAISQHSDHHTVIKHYRPSASGALKCYECSRTIVGHRFKCIECADFDLCHGCEAKHDGNIHPLSHAMIKLKIHVEADQPIEPQMQEAQRQKSSQPEAAVPGEPEQPQEQPLAQFIADQQAGPLVAEEEEEEEQGEQGEHNDAEEQNQHNECGSPSALGWLGKIRDSISAPFVAARRRSSEGAYQPQPTYKLEREQLAKLGFEDGKINLAVLTHHKGDLEAAHLALIEMCAEC